MSRVAKEDPTWDLDRRMAAEEAYRAFLERAKMLPQGQMARPTLDVDKVWHAHILHTEKYARDCDSYFGYFFHHTPEEGTADSATCTGSGCMNNGIRPLQ